MTSHTCRGHYICVCMVFCVQARVYDITCIKITCYVCGVTRVCVHDWVHIHVHLYMYHASGSKQQARQSGLGNQNWWLKHFDGSNPHHPACLSHYCHNTVSLICTNILSTV